MTVKLISYSQVAEGSDLDLKNVQEHTPNSEGEQPEQPNEQGDL